jgi:hypothetical protein
MPGLQLEPGQLSHEVEFGRPDVAVRATEQLRLSALIEPEVVVPPSAEDNALFAELADRA